MAIRSWASWQLVRRISWVVVACAVMVAGTQAAAGRQEGVRRPLDAGAYAIFLVVAVTLVIPARGPWVPLTVTLTLIGSYLLLGYPYGPVLLAASVAVFLAADRSSARASAWLLAIALGVLIVVQLPDAHGANPLRDAGLVAAVSAGLVLPPAWLGALRQRSRQVLAAQASEQQRQLGEQRLALAREVHDVVAHNLSMVSIQAGAALRVFDRDPERAKEALRVIHRTNQESLADLRRALEALRSGDPGESARARAPGLARLPELLGAFRDGGGQVEATVEGRPAEVPSMVDQAAFRIVQESLTNVLRHAGGASTTVRIRYAQAGLALEVSDSGSARDNAPLTTAGERRLAGAGRGLAGLSERAGAVGGRLEYGPRAEGGFQVRAWLPWPHQAG